MQRILVELVNEKLSPFSVPEEAILIPYDLGENETVAADPKQPKQKILVPYDRYVELWNLTHPDDKLETDHPTPVPYALGGAAYEGTLAIEDSLHLEGTIAVELLRDRKQLVPIRIEGGVLTSAKLDGKPAEMSVAEMATPVPRGNGMNRGPNAPPAPQAQPQASASVRQMEQQAALPNLSDQEATLYLLAVEGKGRHVLDLSLRMHVERQGGWRIVSGRLPQAPATSVKLVAPEENLEFRAENNLDPLKWTSEQAGQSLETVPGEEGGIRWQWRPRVSEGEVDRSLTVQSEVFFDVQEDGLAVDWDLDLNFRGGRYDQFRLRLPEDYLVASIEGANVRGWETVEQSDSEARGVLVDVELLQPSTSGESFTVSLWKTRRIDTGDRAKVAVPVVSVVEAAIHRGRITIRHSPLLTVQTIRTAGVSRTERNDSESPTDSSTQQVTQSPLGVSAVQGYLFHSEGYGLELEVSTIPVRQNARLESVMKISEFERRLETRLLLDVHHRPIFQLEIFLPKGFHLDRLSAPGDYQWAITEHEDRRLLTIYLANGQIGRVPILMEGKLDQGKPENPIPLPSFEIPTLDKDVFLSQEIAVQVDPAFEVSARNLENCRTILLERLHWLKPSQRSLTRFGIESTSREFEGVLSLSTRKAEVRSDTITNVRLTRRAVEETILIDFTITRAGIQEVEFLLPPWMADSLIEAPLLKHKTVTPVDADDPQSPLEVRLELQDEVMNQLRVLVRHDRLLIPEREYRASVPTVKTGSVIRQYIVFENAGGRDEMIIDPDSLGDVEALQRQQNAWSRIASLLGAGANEVYLVKDQAKQPELRFRTHQRKAIEMAGARIGLAETRLVMDHNGAWRAEQIYRIDNKTEQNLEIILPEHGGEQQPVRLWTAQLLTAQEWELRRQGQSITGRPVKPSIVPVDDSKSNSSHAEEPKPQEEYERKRREAMEDHRLVLIPLLKTEVGDLDYIVRLVYGGKGVPLRSLGKIEFPFLETLNIPVESSVVKLQLPEDFDFSFDGTMRLVDRNEASDLRTAYSKKTSQRLVQTLRTGTAFEKARALNSLNIFNSILSSKRSTGQALRKFGSSVRNLGESEVSLPEAEKLVELEDRPVNPPPAIENESRIISEYRRQSNARSRNVAVQTEGNFDLGQVQQAAERVKSKKSQFDSKWFMSKQLANSETAMPSEPDEYINLRQNGSNRAAVADMALSVETSDEEKAQNPYEGSQGAKPGPEKQAQ